MREVVTFWVRSQRSRSIYLPDNPLRDVCVIMLSMRILHTNMHRGGWGGQPNRILKICMHLRERGHSVTLAVPRGSTLSRRAHSEGLDVFDDLRFPRGFHPWIYFSEVQKLRRLIEEKGIRIVHTHGSQDTWAGVVAARLAHPSALVVRTRHNTNPVGTDVVHRWLYTRLIHRVIANSDAVREEFRRNKLVEPHRVETIFSAVDTRLFNSSISGDGVRAALNIPSDVPLVGIVGRLDPKKGHQYFLEAAQKVCRHIPSTMFLVVGEGPLDKELRAYTRELRIEGKVIFTDLREDVPPILAALDVFAISSLKESFPTSILEAMAMERPVVATRVGSIESSVLDGITGYVVPPSDPGAMAEKIISLLHDRKTARTMGKAGRQLVMERFNEEIMAQKTEKVYIRLLEEANGEGKQNYREMFHR